MEFLRTFESFQSKFGIFYLRPVFPEGHNLEWLNYYKISTVPHRFRLDIKSLSNTINSRSGVIVKMDSHIHPGV